MRTPVPGPYRHHSYSDVEALDHLDLHDEYNYDLERTLHTQPLLTRHRELPHLLTSRPASPSRRYSAPGSAVLHNHHHHVPRSMRLIGASKALYDWTSYLKNPEELRAIKDKKIRAYHAHNNHLIHMYMYIDRLLDSDLPHNLLREYTQDRHESTISEVHPFVTHHGHGSGSAGSPEELLQQMAAPSSSSSSDEPVPAKKVKRRPSYLYKIADESSPLLNGEARTESVHSDPGTVRHSTAQDRERIVMVAIYINMAANIFLLVAKVVITLMTSSLSVVASLVDGAMDFLSSTIILITAKLIEHRNHHEYPVGSSRLEPIGVLVFSVIMITAFVQVGVEGFQRLFGPEHELVRLTPIAVSVMLGTVIVKGACWFWCRLVKNSSVQALAADAWTDVVFNTFSILFPLVGYYCDLWWADALGGIALSFYVIISWARISKGHIRNLTGAAAHPDIHAVLLYLTMRFATSIKQITAVQAYHAGDNLHVEVDLVLDEHIGLRDSHDLGESLQYVIESLPIVERAFVHLDYTATNPYGHLR